MCLLEEWYIADVESQKSDDISDLRKTLIAYYVVAMSIAYRFNHVLSDQSNNQNVDFDYWLFIDFD